MASEWTGRAVGLVLLLLSAPPVAAQALTDRITFDSLQLSALAVDFGAIRVAQSEDARVFGMAADYGKLSRTLRLRFDVSYWESRLTDEVMRTFTDSLRSVITDPSGDDVVQYSRVRLYDVAMGTGVRWVPLQTTLFQPFIASGVAVHVINAEGPLIDGTFVERLFDNLSTGLFGEAGVSFKALSRVALEARIRGDLVNGFHALSLRAGGVYYFGPLRRSDP